MASPLLALDNLVISQEKSMFTDSFSICDQQGRTVGTVLQGSAFKDFLMSSRSLAITATDYEGTPLQPVAVITDPPNFMADTYEVHTPEGGQVIATVRTRFSFFKTKLTMTMDDFDSVEVTGNFWDRNFTMLSAGREIARVSSGFKSIGAALMGKSVYHLDMVPGLSEDQHAAILGATMSLDMLLTKRREKN